MEHLGKWITTVYAIVTVMSCANVFNNRVLNQWHPVVDKQFVGTFTEEDSTSEVPSGAEREREYVPAGDMGIDLEVLWDGELVRIISDPLSDSYPRPYATAQYPKPFVTYAEQTVTLQEKGYQHLLQAGLKDAADYGDRIFFDLVLHPQKAREYGRILTKSSVDAWGKIPWVYANPAGYYDSVNTYRHQSEDKQGYTLYTTEVYLKDKTAQVDRTTSMKLDRYDLHKVAPFSNQLDISIQIEWEYERSTGKIQVVKVWYRDSSEENKERFIKQLCRPKWDFEGGLQWAVYDYPFISYAEARKIDIQELPYTPSSNPNLVIHKVWEEETVGGGEMFLKLVRDPSRVEEYGAILTETTVEAWENFPWIYAHPEKYYSQIYSNAWWDIGDYAVYETKITIPPEYFIYDELMETLDRTLNIRLTKEQIDYLGCHYTPAVVISWEYEKRTGLIQVSEIEYRFPFK